MCLSHLLYSVPYHYIVSVEHEASGIHLQYNQYFGSVATDSLEVPYSGTGSAVAA